MYKRSVFYFILVLIIAVAGFYPSYFAILPQVDVIHHFHGVCASAWMLLLIVQAGLYRAGKLSTHRVTGRISFVLVPLFLLSGLLMIRTMLLSQSGFYKVFGSRLAFLDMVTIFTFALAFCLAIRNRKNIQLHARYMAITAVLVMPPALGRLLPVLSSAINSFEMSVNISYGICIAIALALNIRDYREGKLRPPYFILLISILIQLIGFYALKDNPVWLQFLDVYKSL
jgi:hypothetical protein